MTRNIIFYFLLFVVPMLGASALFGKQAMLPSIYMLLGNKQECTIVSSTKGERQKVCRNIECGNIPAPAISGYGESCQVSSVAAPHPFSFHGHTPPIYSAWAQGNLCVTATDFYGEAVLDFYGEEIELCDTVENTSTSEEFNCGLGIDTTGAIVEICTYPSNIDLVANPSFTANIRKLNDYECITALTAGYQQSKTTCTANCLTNGNNDCDTAVHFF